ncbi:hypothetical protein FPFC_070260 [Fructobacillus pseudoficulneus]|uniref:Integral membrane protein n=2 Tax=Fructobacillus pseudoficulneus TaxID=220714 RepID=A0A3F3H6M2_9LACO|nr:hypothetical protein FPFC_070260 [Fructobacillus pseudoficulneus]
MLAFALLYIIKANMVILIPAALLLFLLIFIFKIRGLWQSAILLAALIFGLGFATVAVKPVYQHYGYSQADQAKIALPVTHWINMGLNPLGSSGQGAYDKKDEHLDQQRKAQKRTDLITESIQKRLKMLGVGGVVKLGITKSQMLLGRPLFGFGRYMSGYAHAPAWYLKHQSLFNTLFSILATTILLMVMGNFLYSLWRPTYEEEFTDAQQGFLYFVGLASLGLAFFHSFIWEVEPRYFLPLLYPLIILGLLFLPSGRGHGNHHPWRISYNRTTLFVLPICSLLMLTLTLDAAKDVPGVAYGNMEYPIRIALRERVTVTDDLHFSLPVPQAVDVLKVGIEPQKHLEVQLADGQQLEAKDGEYRLEKHFAAGEKIDLVLHNTSQQPLKVLLYRQTSLYKKLFHGSRIERDGNYYYLPYEMDIYDRKPFEVLDVNNQPMLR